MAMCQREVAFCKRGCNGQHLAKILTQVFQI
jgi:hypothetical protein